MTKEEVAREALAAASNYSRCGLGVTMGGGKTLIGLLHMHQDHRPANKYLVVAPKLEIYKTWQEEAKKFNLAYLLDHIVFTTYKSLVKQPQFFTGIYLDECHSLKYTHEVWLQLYHGKILGLTGTPPRSAISEKGIMIDRYCPMVYTYGTDKAVNDRVLNDYRIVVHHLQLDTAKTVEVVNRNNNVRWYQSEFKVYEYWDEKLSAADELVRAAKGLSKAPPSIPGPKMLSTKDIRLPDHSTWDKLLKNQELLRIRRMNILKGFPSKIRYCKQLIKQSVNKIIVFVSTQDQADEVSQYSYHARNPDSKKNLELFKAGIIHAIATVLQLSEGTNIPNLREGVLQHAYSNERKGPQMFGRLFRLNPDDCCLLHVLCYDNTADEQWVSDAFQEFDANKIYHYYPEEGVLTNNIQDTVRAIELPWGNYMPGTRVNAVA